MRGVWLILQLLALYRGAAEAQGDEIREQLEEFITDVMEEHGIPGMVVAIVKDGQPYMTQGFGLANLEEGTPVTDDTLMYTASTGKAFTAAMVSKVLERTEYSLDTPVREILGEEFEVNDGYRRHHINTRDLLSHRVCIPTPYWHYYFGAMEDRDDLLYRSRFLDPLLEFRSTMDYSDMWYTWAGRLAERLTGKGFEELVREEILEPLNMLDTQYISDMPEEEFTRMATPYQTRLTGTGLRPVQWGAYSCGGPENPSGGMVSNAKDLVQWLAMQTNGGRNGDGDVVMEEEVWKETIAPNVFLPWRSPTQPDRPVTFSEDMYGLGWNIGYYRGYPIHTHTGTMWGFYARAMVMPDMGHGTYLVANGPGSSEAGNAQRKIEQYTLDLLLGEEPWLNASTPILYHPDPEEARMDEHMEKINAKFGAEIVKGILVEHGQWVEGGRQKRSSSPLSNKALYAGTYGTYCCGNVTVTYDADADALSGTYGDCGSMDLVVVDEEQHQFLAVFNEPMWFVWPSDVQFFSDDGGASFDRMYAPGLFWSTPLMLYRDLTMDTQPDMPEDCP